MSLTNPTTYNTSGSQADGHSATIGSTSDASTATTLVGLLKKLVSLLPASLVSGRLDTQASQATAANLNATAAQGTGSGSAATFWYTRVTDGTNTTPTMDVVGRAGFQKITDGTNTASVTAGSSSAAFSAAAMTTAPRPAPSFSYITSATTTAVKTSAGVIRSIEITAPFTVGSLTVYNANNAATNPIAGFGWNVSGVFLRNLSCSNGITVVTGAGFNGQVTVTYE